MLSWPDASTPQRSEDRRISGGLLRPVKETRWRTAAREQLSGSEVRTRAIVIFPPIMDLSPIVPLRERFDPLARLIPARSTLVFPFDDPRLADELRSHGADATRGVAPCTVRLADVSGIGSEYIVVNIADGKDDVVDLHDRLYTGRLRRHLSPVHSYVPHLTIGRLMDAPHFVHALEVAQAVDMRVTTTVSAISVCSREADGRWFRDFNVALAKR